MQSIGTYQAHLERVSRSFAFCIRKLEPPLRQWVSLSYLLCRALDTIEDSAWGIPGLQAMQFESFERFLNVRSTEREVIEWAARFPSSIPEGERELLKDIFLFFEDLHSLPEKVQQAIRSSVLRMSGGMRHYSLIQSVSGELRLRDLMDVNRYCYFVAGLVGELLTKLLWMYRPDLRQSPELMKNAFHFGLFLQKVNLLKDQRVDEEEGRRLVPDRSLVISSLRDNARGALLYLTSLPKEERGYRTFCAWSLFLGLTSLPWIQQGFEDGSGLKIPRSATETLLSQIEAIVQDDWALLGHGEECIATLPVASETWFSTGKTDDPSGHAWFRQLSGAVLSSRDLEELGICQGGSEQRPVFFQASG